MRTWKEGMMRITPIQLLKGEIKGYIGSIAGTIFAAILFLFVYDSLWAISIVMFFNVLIQAMQLISKLQQLEMYKKLDNIEDLQTTIGEVKDGN